jgi:NADP-dependent 3-hydroxy acid dehydrogenase YdfG
MISPGAVATEIAEGSPGEATRKNLRQFFKTVIAIPPDSIAQAIAYAIEQPPRWKLMKSLSGPRHRISSVN